jgi:glycosyltransferase involved in cell wall biosynthesis
VPALPVVQLRRRVVLNGLPALDVAIVANGFAEGPAQALRDYLVDRGSRVVTILHPLTRDQGTRHLVATHAERRLLRSRTIDPRLRPPLSYLADLFVPWRPPPVDAWFGFNPLACARGLLARRAGRAACVVLWSVDFVPDRFGAGTPGTRLYDRLDRLCCLRADARVELSDAAREARDRRHGVRAKEAPAYIVPMGAWLDRVPTTPPDGYAHRRVVFLGHLVPRQGVEVLLDALALLRARGDEVEADVIGTGPLEASLRQRASGLGTRVHFHGFVADHREIERLLAQASIAVAPYRPVETFTQYADPGKLKAYLAAGLPIVLTDVPPNAQELARHGGAEIVAYDATAIAEGISRALASPDGWQKRRAAALGHARRFDWPVLLSDLLRKLGLEPPAGPAADAP